MAGLNDTFASWMSSFFSCCGVLAPCLQDRKQLRRNSEKSFVILYDQPTLVPPPTAGLHGDEQRMSARDYYWSRGAGANSQQRGSFYERNRFGSGSSVTRRPRISAPSNFRHVYSESFQFPGLEPQPEETPEDFRPLELRIYTDDNNRLSSILPYFDQPHPSISPPPEAHTTGAYIDDDSTTLNHSRSYSSVSFHIPRRNPYDESAPPSRTASQNESPPRIPPRSRKRANTAPNTEHMIERIAEAMNEKDRLQAEIDSVIERQSIYTSSRPSTAYGGTGGESSFASQAPIASLLERKLLESIPAVPALPAAAPSFAERLSSERPRTAPSVPFANLPRPAKQFEEASALYTLPPRQISPSDSYSSLSSYSGDLDRPLAPPLPLVLRPPLRKKKSFSRVSNWLFPADHDNGHQRDISLDSITNAPRPVTDRDGFYQIMQVPAATEDDRRRRRSSMESVSSVSSWTTESEEETRTYPTTTWSPGSTPAAKMESMTPPATTPLTGRSAASPAAARAAQDQSRTGQGARPTSVGVAF